jgi:HEAT repeat protein
VATVAGDDEANLRFWTDRLKDKDAARRLHALSMLGSLGPGARGALTGILGALHDECATVRKVAVAVLGEIGPEPLALPGLIGALQDPEEPVRKRAILVLGDMGPEGRVAAPALMRLLREGSPLVRRLAAAALGEIGPSAPAAIPALIDALAEDDVKNRAVIAAALGKMGSRAVPRLLEALKHADPRVRCHVARTLVKGPQGRDAVPSLIGLLHDEDALVRETAADALQCANVQVGAGAAGE